MTKRCAWVLVWIAAAATGCGSSAKAGPDAAVSIDAPTTTTTQACADLAHAECALRMSCTSGFNISDIYGTEATCEARTAEACTNQLGAPATAQTPNNLEVCVASYPSFACDDFFDSNEPAACFPPMGSGATSSACSTSAECASGYCALTQFEVCGTCQPQPAVGAICQVRADCGRDLACAIAATATTGTCAAFVGSGGSCLTGTNQCASGFACVGETVASSTAGTCQPTGATVGAACDSARKTMANCAADLGLTCIQSGVGTTVGACQMTILVATGATCGTIGTPETSFAVCQAGGLCKKAVATDRTGICVAAVADGAACNSDPTVGPPCLTPAKCVPTAGNTTAGTCTLPASTTCH